MTSPGGGGEVSFEPDIGPVVGEKDRDAMMGAFDLCDYSDVSDNGD